MMHHGLMLKTLEFFSLSNTTNMSSKQTQFDPSLKLTVKSERRRQPNNTSNTESKQQNEPIEPILKDKLIASFRKFKLLPNNNEYYIAIIRSLGTDAFRLVLVDKEGFIRTGIDKQKNIKPVWDATSISDTKLLSEDISQLFFNQNKPYKK